MSMEYRGHFREGGDEQEVGAGWHWLHDDCIKVVDVCDKYIYCMFLNDRTGKAPVMSVHIVPSVALARVAKQNISWTMQALWGVHI